MSRLHVLPGSREAAAAAAAFILSRLRGAVERSGKASLAVSGGSTPKLMFQEIVRQGLGPGPVDLFWADERCVPPDHPDSNYGTARRDLIEPLGLGPGRVHRIRGELAPREAAADYERELRESFGLSEGEIPRFDVIHLGMGSDSHIASLFPGDPLIADREGLAAPVWADSRESWRVTLLPRVLLEAAAAVFLVSGKDKAKALRAVLEGEEDFPAHPAQLVERRGLDVVWFVDKAAAGKLDGRV